MLHALGRLDAPARGGNAAATFDFLVSDATARAAEFNPQVPTPDTSNPPNRKMAGGSIAASSGSTSGTNEPRSALAATSRLGFAVWSRVDSVGIVVIDANMYIHIYMYESLRDGQRWEFAGRAVG